MGYKCSHQSARVEMSFLMRRSPYSCWWSLKRHWSMRFLSSSLSNPPLLFVHVTSYGSQRSKGQRGLHSLTECKRELKSRVFHLCILFTSRVVQHLVIDTQFLQYGECDLYAGGPWVAFFDIAKDNFRIYIKFGGQILRDYFVQQSQLS